MLLTARRKRIAQSNTAHPGKPLQVIFKLIEEGELLGGRRIILPEIDVGGQHTVVTHAKGLIFQIPQAAEQKGCTGEQDERDCDLPRDQHLTEPTGRSADRETSGESLGTRILQGRHQSEENAGKNRDSQSKQQDARVEMRLLKARNAFGADDDKKPEQEMPEQTSGDGADDAQQQTLDESLLDQPGTRGTEGRANCQFPLPARGSCKQKIRNVGTGDQKHGNNGCEQNPEGEANIGDLAIA